MLGVWSSFSGPRAWITELHCLLIRSLVTGNYVKQQTPTRFELERRKRPLKKGKETGLVSAAILHAPTLQELQLRLFFSLFYISNRLERQLRFRSHLPSLPGFGTGVVRGLLSNWASGRVLGWCAERMLRLRVRAPCWGSNGLTEKCALRWQGGGAHF